jgi:hypothetical protein
MDCNDSVAWLVYSSQSFKPLTATGLSMFPGPHLQAAVKHPEVEPGKVNHNGALQRAERAPHERRRRPRLWHGLARSQRRRRRAWHLGKLAQCRVARCSQRAAGASERRQRGEAAVLQRARGHGVQQRRRQRR